MFVKYFKANMIKLKRTGFYSIHFIIAIIGVIAYLFIIYFQNQNLVSKSIGFFGAIAEIMPLVVSLLCAKVIDTEKNAGNFQSLLTSRSKLIPMLSCLSIMYLSELVALLIASNLFIFIFGIIYKEQPFFYSFYLQVILILFLMFQFLYLIHNFLSLRFNSTISVSYGVFECLLAMLMISSLGEKYWMLFPCAWPLRMLKMLMDHEQQTTQVWFFGYFPVFLAVIAIIYILYMLWYYYWEGSKIEE